MSHTLTLPLALSLSLAVFSLARAKGDAEDGKTLFARCAAFHAVTAQNKTGPGLAGVFWRQAGTAVNFHYSKALAGYAKVWDDQTLDSYLAAPGKAVPGTTMMVGVPSAPDRADIIVYLKTIGAQ
jgi:cytochrome c